MHTSVMYNDVVYDTLYEEEDKSILFLFFFYKGYNILLLGLG